MGDTAGAGRQRAARARPLDDALLEAVVATVGGLQHIAEAISDPSYIRGQSAERVGSLYGVLADKAVRFLEAAGADQAGDGGGEEQP